MPKRNVVLSLLLCLATVLVGWNASAASVEQPKTRVWAFAFASALSIRLDDAASPRTPPEKSLARYDGALGSPHAAKGAAEIANLERVGSGLKVDFVKPIRDGFGNIVKEFPASPIAHGFPDVVDNFAGAATQFELRSGTSLFQVEGSMNGMAGRFEWIVDQGAVTHRMFVGGGTLNGVPIVP